MLRFFFTRKKLPTIQTLEASSFELISASEFQNSTIPFSHMYITSDSYLKQIKVSLKEQQNSIIQVSDEQTEVILQQSNFPPNLTDYNINSVSELITILSNENNDENNIGDKNKDINIAIINGIGGDYGDNFIGLALLQRLSKLLSPRKVTFHLMQSLNLRFAEIYENNAELIEANVVVQNNIMDVESFMAMNAYINLTGIVNYIEFEAMSHNTFFSTAFSLENIISDVNLHPNLAFNSELTSKVRTQIEDRFDEKKSIIFLHPIAADILKTCPPEFVQTLIQALIDQGFQVITPNTVQFKNVSFSDCSDLTTSLFELTHVISACDIVITTGSLSLSIATALGKPTILLPITKSNIRTAKQFAEVLIWLPYTSENLYIKEVKSQKDSDLKVAQQIWNNIDTKKLANAITEFQTFFHRNTERSFIKRAPKRIAVVLPFCHDSNEYNERLKLCLNGLVKVEGFDALWLDIIDCRDKHMYKTHALNTGMSKSLENKCDYVWLLDPEQLPKPDYLIHALKRFESDSAIAIVTGMQINNKNKTRVSWAGSLSSFPKRQHKSGNFSNPKVHIPTSEHWVPFQSAIIRTSTIVQLGLLDESLGNKLSDADYCFRLIKRGWSIAYEPKAQSYRVDMKDFIEPENLEALKKDAKYFHQKWSTLTGCDDTDKLHRSILKYIHRHHKKHALLH